MFLKRIQVPDYKVLKDVDISFEENFTPKVFPLGSENGGGKSTLLQLVFTLLHCSFDDSRKEYVKNLLENFEINNKKDKKKTLAKIELVYEGKDMELDFFVVNDSYLPDKKMDFNSGGMPMEDYGTTNNIMSFGPPQFVNAKFEVKDKDLNFDIKF